MEIVIAKNKFTGTETVTFTGKNFSRMYWHVTKASMGRVKSLARNGTVRRASERNYTMTIIHL